MIESIFYGGIRKRLLKDNQNWLAFICGQTGSGKSYSSLTMANNITSIKIENVVFNPKQFMERINSGELKKGDFLIFDEAGVGMSSRNWNSIQNKLLGAVLQTFRNMNIGVIFTTPNLEFVDVQARTLTHNYFETAWIDRRLKVAHLRPYEFQHNSKQGKTYIKNPRFRINGQRVQMTDLSIRMPPPELVKAYEKAKTEYTIELNKNVLKELQPDEKNSSKTFMEYANDFLAMDHRDDYSVACIESMLNVTNVKARAVRKQVIRIVSTEKPQLVVNKRH